MKKVILSAIVLGGIAMNANAQITIAPEVGVNLANMTSKYESPIGGETSLDTKMKLGLKAGAVVTIPVAKGFFIQPGFFYSMKGAKMSESETVLGQTFEYKSNINTSYLEIPVNLGYEYKIGNAGSVFATVGPYLGYACGGKVKSEGTLNATTLPEMDEETDIEFGSDATDDMKPMDIGVNFSAGYKLPMGLYVRAQYGMSLTNLANEDNGTLKNKVLSFSLGYAFKL